MIRKLFVETVRVKFARVGVAVAVTLMIAMAASVTNAALVTVSFDPISIAGVNSNGDIGPFQRYVTTPTIASDGFESQVIAHYDLGGVATSFVSAILTVEWQDNGDFNPVDIRAFDLGDGSVGADDFNTGVNLVGSVGFFHLGSGVQYDQFDISTLVQSGLNNNDAYLSLNLRAFSPDSFTQTNVEIFSLGIQLTSDIQQLSTVPLPAALPLFLSGLVGLGIVGRKRRKCGRKADGVKAA